MAHLTTLGQPFLEPAAFRQPKPLALLAYLALEGPQVRRHLAELFWPQGQSMKSLSMALTRLSHAVPGCVTSEGARLHCQLTCDAVLLLEALDAGDLESAQALHGGLFLEGVELSSASAELAEWVLNRRRRIEERYAMMAAQNARLPDVMDIVRGAGVNLAATTVPPSAPQATVAHTPGGSHRSPGPHVSAALRLQVLGQLTLCGSALHQTKPLLLLAYLTLEGRQPRSTLERLFWPAGRSSKSLSMALTRLRQAAPGCVSADAKYAWSAVSCDAHDFQQAARAVDLNAASKVYLGPFADGADTGAWGTELEEWLNRTREALAASMRDLLLTHAGHALSNGAPGASKEAAALAARAWQLTGVGRSDPLTERLLYWFLAADGHPAAGEVAAALDELEEVDRWPGTPPAQNVGGDPGGFFTPACTSFIGRESELAQVCALLQLPQTRVLSIVGQGGAGKSRLATEAMRALRELAGANQRIVVVSLAPIANAEQVPGRITRLLSDNFGPPGTDGWHQLTSRIGTRPLLLLLDNLEHIPELGPHLDRLLGACPNLRVLATARTPVGCAHERTVRLAGLPLAQRNLTWTAAMVADAVRLLVERVAETAPGLDLGDQAKAALRLCEAVGGLPLGIELAAGLLRYMPVDELAALVETDPDILAEADSNRLPSRHTRLTNVLDAAWARCTRRQRAALAGLSVFEAGFSREAALELVHLTQAELEELTDAAWLHSSGAARLAIHPYVKAFLRRRAAERPKRTEAAKKAHLNLCLMAARATATRLHSQELPLAALTLDEEHSNMLAALEYAAVRDPVAATELAVLLTPYWLLRAFLAEGLDRLTTALIASDALLDRSNSLFADAQLQVGRLATRLSRWNAARVAFSTALKCAEAERRARQMAEAHLGLAMVASSDSQLDEAHASAAAGLHWAEVAGDPLLQSDGHRQFVTLHNQAGDYVRAASEAEQSLRMAEAGNDPARVAMACVNLATSLGYLGERDRSATLNQRALAIMVELGDRNGQAGCLVNLGYAAGERGDQDERERLYLSSLELFRQLGDERGAVHVLLNLAAGKQFAGHPAEAKALLDESLTWHTVGGENPQLARTHQLYGQVLLDLGEHASAKEHLAESMEICRRRGEGRQLVWTLITLARWHGDVGEIEEARRAALEAVSLAAVNTSGRQLRRAQDALRELEEHPNTRAAFVPLAPCGGDVASVS